VVKNLFGNSDPVGEKILIGRITFNVIGVMESKGVDLNGIDQDDQIFIPLQTALRRLRMAVGASKIDILIQFVIEASILSISGGIIGIILGIIISIVISLATDWNLSISIPSIIYSFIFSLIVGMFFGVYPARKASLLDPIEALKNE